LAAFPDAFDDVGGVVLCVVFGEGAAGLGVCGLEVVAAVVEDVDGVAFDVVDVVDGGAALFDGDAGGSVEERHVVIVAGMSVIVG
jgi:hypothetical protein